MQETYCIVYNRECLLSLGLMPVNVTLKLPQILNKRAVMCYLYPEPQIVAICGIANSLIITLSTQSGSELRARPHSWAFPRAHELVWSSSARHWLASATIFHLVKEAVCQLREMMCSCLKIDCKLLLTDGQNNEVGVGVVGGGGGSVNECWAPWEQASIDF